MLVGESWEGSGLGWGVSPPPGLGYAMREAEESFASSAAMAASSDLTSGEALIALRISSVWSVYHVRMVSRVRSVRPVNFLPHLGLASTSRKNARRRLPACGPEDLRSAVNLPA